jgi:hypothetical protein
MAIRPALNVIVIVNRQYRLTRFLIELTNTNDVRRARLTSRLLRDNRQSTMYSTWSNLLFRWIPKRFAPLSNLVEQEFERKIV